MERYVIKRAEIEAMQGLAKTHFLNACAQRNNKSLGDLTGLTGFGFHVIEVPPGRQSTEYHMHHYEDECVYVLAGDGTVRIGDGEHAIEAGDFIGYRAGGCAHTMVNTGATPLKCIVVGGRIAHDIADYPRLRKRLFRNAGRPWELVDFDAIDHPVAGRKA
ncbi:MAG: cupin domain-containing protein [Gammaproteobacteria bacterium]|nr:cupin domain-containing protein [Gammaproteobacteria bacterium]